MVMQAALPQIRPISDLRTRLNDIENLARESREPIIMTKNGTASLIVIDSDAYDEHLHHALHNRKRSHIKISAKGLKTRIENDSDQAFCGLHDKGGHAQRRNPGYNLLFQSHIGQPDPKPGPLSTQKADNPAGTDSLGENCGQGRAAHPHLEPKNKNRVQDDI